VTHSARRLRRWAGLAWSFLVVSAIVIVLRERAGPIREIASGLHGLPLGFGLMLILAAKGLFGGVLRRAAAQHAVVLSESESSWIQHVSQLAKYLPGSVWHFVSKSHFLTLRGASPVQSAKILATETTWVIASAGLVGVAGVAIFAPFELRGSLPFLAPKHLSLLLLFALGIGAANRRWSFLVFPPRGAAIRLGAIWLLLGASFAGVMASLTQDIPFSPSFIFFIVAAFALAYVAGFLSPFAPAGIGVREGVLVALTSPAVGFETAVVAAALSRLIFVLAECVVAGFALARQRKHPFVSH